MKRNKEEEIAMFEIKISAEDLLQLEARLSSLAEQGIEAETRQSGELNMSGCASSSCMAWD